MQVDRRVIERRERLRVYRWLLVAGAVLVVGWLLWVARGSLFPFMLGLLVAYLLAPVVTAVERLIPGRGFLARARRPLAVVVVYLLFIGALVTLVMTFGPRLVNETLNLIDNAPTYVDAAREQFTSWEQKYEETVPPDMQVTIEENVDKVGEFLASAASTALETTFGTVRWFIGFLAGVALLPLWLFYVLKDDRKAMDFFYRLWPPAIQSDVRHIVGIADRVLGAYVRGQLFLGIVVGAVTFIGLFLLDVQYAGPLGILAGFFELIPILGPWLSFVAAAIVVLATDPGKIWLVAALFLAIQQLENTFLVPKIQGDAVEMNPAVIMVLLVVGGAVFGFLGIVVIVPLAAIARDVFVYVHRRLEEEEAAA